VIGIAASALIVIGAAWIWWKNQSGPVDNATAALPTPQFTAEQDQSMRDRVQEAEQKAQSAWRDDATLMVVSLPFTDLALSAESPPITYFYSASDSQDDYYCEISADLSRLGNCGVESKTTETADPPLLPIASESWGKSIGDVIAQAETQGGKYYRLNHTQAQFVLELTNSDLTGLVWNAIYDAVNADTPQMIPIDAALAPVDANANSGQ
jgi:hypothetical protein